MTHSFDGLAFLSLQNASMKERKGMYTIGVLWSYLQNYQPHVRRYRCRLISSFVRVSYQCEKINVDNIVEENGRVEMAILDAPIILEHQ